MGENYHRVHILSLIAGIDSATSQYACIWCKCPAGERYNPDTQWSMSDPSQGARSIQENVQTAAKPRQKKFNVSHPPLFPTIPLTNVVVDNLHLFLRVSDVLINLLIVELRRQDAIDKVTKFSSFDPVKYKHCSGFEKFVSDLGIPSYHFYIGQNSKQLKIRTLTGPEKHKVISNIRIADLLPNLSPSKVLQIQWLWTELLHLNQTFSKRPEELSQTDIDSYEQQA